MTHPRIEMRDNSAREDARRLLHDAERTILKCRRSGKVNPEPHEKNAHKLRNQWKFF